MSKTWYRNVNGKKEYNANEENAKLITFIGRKTQEISKENISSEVFRYYLREGILIPNLKDILYIDLEEMKDEIFEIAKQRRDISGLSKLGISDWNDKKDEIFEIAKQTGLYGLSELSKLEIDWNDKKDEIFEIAKQRRDISGLSKLGISDWNDKKDEIFEIAKQSSDILGLSELGISDWNDKKDEILEIAKQSRNILGLSGLGINWNDKKDEIFEIAKQRSDIYGLSKLGISDWNDKKDEILEIAKQRGLYGLSELSNLSELGISDWNDKKDEILEIAKQSRDIYGLSKLGVSDWNDKKDEILEIAKQSRNRYGLSELSNLSELGISDWNDKKDEILEIAKQSRNILGLSKLGISDWNDKKDEILEIAKQIGLYGLSELGIDWNDKKDEILEIVKQKSLYRLSGLSNLSELGIDWNDKKGEILEIAKQSKTLDGLSELKIDWNDKKDEILEIAKQSRNRYGLSELQKLLNLEKNELYNVLIQVIKNTDSELYQEIKEIEQKNNPVYNLDINMSLNFDKAPWLTDDVDKLTEEDIKKEREFFVEILDRLDGIGAISQCTMFENYKNKEIGLELQDNNIENLRENLNNFSNIEISAYLLFYLNKLTKINETTMYYKALGNFEYNETYEKVLESGNVSKEDEAYKYEQKRNKAEEKGDMLIKAISYLKRRYKEVEEANNNVQKNKISSAEVKLKPFTELLENWKKIRDGNGYFPQIQNIEENDSIQNTSNINKFYKEFNEQIKSLTDKDCSLEEIEDSFIYGSNALELQDKLYNFKDTLLQQLIEYAKKSENKNKIAIQYKKNIRDGEKGSETEIYVFLKGVPVPMCFHADINNLKNVEGFSEVGQEIKNYFNEESINFISPITERDNEVIKSWINGNKETEKNEKLDSIIYSLVGNKGNPINALSLNTIKSDKKYKDAYSSDEIQQILKSVTDYFSEERNDLRFSELFNKYNGNEETNDKKVAKDNLLNKIDEYLNPVNTQPNLNKKERFLLEIMNFLVKRDGIKFQDIAKSPEYEKYKNNINMLKEIRLERLKETTKIFSSGLTETEVSDSNGSKFEEMKKRLGIEDYKADRNQTEIENSNDELETRKPEAAENYSDELEEYKKVAINALLQAGCSPDKIEQMLSLNDEMKKYLNETYGKTENSKENRTNKNTLEDLRNETSDISLGDIEKSGDMVKKEVPEYAKENKVGEEHE